MIRETESGDNHESTEQEEDSQQGKMKAVGTKLLAGMTLDRWPRFSESQIPAWPLTRKCLTLQVSQVPPTNILGILNTEGHSAATSWQTHPGSRQHDMETHDF